MGTGLERGMTVIAVVLAVGAAAVVGLGFGVGLAATDSLVGGGLLALGALYVLRYRRWLQLHPPGTDWQPSRCTRVTMGAMSVFASVLNAGVVVFGALLGLVVIVALYHDAGNGNFGMILLWIIVLLILVGTLARALRSARRDWRRIVGARSSTHADNPQAP